MIVCIMVVFRQLNYLKSMDQGMVQRGINFAVVDHDFVDALGIKIVNGRDFQQDMPSDTLNSVVVNQTLATRLGWSDPVGKRYSLGTADKLMQELLE
jgi:putative ABC transport system permease protein